MSECSHNRPRVSHNARRLVVVRCRCGASYVGHPDNAPGWVSDAISGKNKTDFDRLLEKLGYSQRSAARMLQIDDRTVRRYASGELNPPHHIVRLLLLERIVDLALEAIPEDHPSRDLLEAT